MEEVPRKPSLHESFGCADDLFAVLAHEIANPLNNISAAVQLLQQRWHDKEDRVDEASSELLQLLGEEIKRLSRLLEDFRSLQFFSLDLQPTSLAAVVEGCLALESIKAAPSSIRLESDVPLDLPLVMADTAKLKQALLNLCQNAIEAMPGGGTVTVRAYTTPAEVCLEVIDSGEGILEDIQVFAPFVTTKASGSGIGLFVAQRVMSAHGGTITYTSKKGEGTIFHLAFPIHNQEPVPDAQRSISTIPAGRL